MSREIIAGQPGGGPHGAAGAGHKTTAHHAGAHTRTVRGRGPED